ncbi:hypothetical protein O2N63_15960 [Aliiroseovarius sp. KMU-50]|uniref:Uncharacterized protein n=1 Tax=Aliiroseovarius salicola TaxID=3009082 RepID=A0ABT4W542_9RHOB|nr:hypothetical protein [Aliiroseovarius sp. KMU-50]MDA5095585.1 hypothetical protein [Aliiroseovarius sp. KMU-50]
MSSQPICLSRDELNATIQALSYMLSQTEESEFHTLVGLPKSKGHALTDRLNEIFRSMK